MDEGLVLATILACISADFFLIFSLENSLLFSRLSVFAVKVYVILFKQKGFGALPTRAMISEKGKNQDIYLYDS